MNNARQRKQNLLASNILYTKLVVSLLFTSIDILAAPMSSGMRSRLIGSMLFLHLLDGLLFTYSTLLFSQGVASQIIKQERATGPGYRA